MAGEELLAAIRPRAGRTSADRPPATAGPGRPVDCSAHGSARPPDQPRLLRSRRGRLDPGRAGGHDPRPEGRSGGRSPSGALLIGLALRADRRPAVLAGGLRPPSADRLPRRLDPRAPPRCVGGDRRDDLRHPPPQGVFQPPIALFIVALVILGRGDAVGRALMRPDRAPSPRRTPTGGPVTARPDQPRRDRALVRPVGRSRAPIRRPSPRPRRPRRTPPRSAAWPDAILAAR